MNSLTFLRCRGVLWGVAIAACLFSGFLVMVTKVPVRAPKGGPGAGVAQGSPLSPAAFPAGSGVQPRLVKAYGRLPLSFEINKGQTDSRVKFLSRGSGYSLFLTGNEAVLTLGKKSGGRSPKSGGPPFRAAHQGGADLLCKSAALLRDLLPTAEQFRDSVTPRDEVGIPKPESRTPAVLRMKLVGVNAHAKLSGLEELPGKSNYFIGNDPKKWRTNVPNYAKVKYANVYPGVDLVYYGNQGKLEYDFVVQPGADPRQIVLDVGAAMVAVPQAREHPQGVPLRVDGKGDLVVATDGGEVIFHKPVVYQPAMHHEPRTKTQEPRTKELIDGRYMLAGNRVTFEIARYDKTKPLVIDPTLAYSTYLGGCGGDVGGGIAVDSSGNAYVTGYTGSSDFPTTSGAFQTTFGGSADVFISKLNPTGSALVYSTYLGGSGFDQGTAIALDSLGNAYVTGWTGSSNFPITSGAFQSTLRGGADAFISKLNAAGSALIYSTYLGGSGGELGNYFGIAVDGAGNVYVTGDTYSFDFPTTPGAFQTTFGGGGEAGTDAFVSKVNAAGSGLVYSTYLGGSDDDEGTDIAVDASGNAYVSGHTFSSNFPTSPGAFQTTYLGFDDAFVSKLNASGSALVFSTYLAGSVSSAGGFNVARFALAVNASGNAYVTGYTGASDFPTTPGAFQTTYGGGFFDAFVSKLNATGSALVYSTYLGGSNYDAGSGMAIDTSGNAYVTGQTNSTNFPTTPGAFQTTCSSCPSLADAFVSKLNGVGSALLYSTYLGGSDEEDQSGAGVAVDASGNAYVTGGTYSSDFPTTPGAFQTTFGGNQNSFISKFSFGIPFSSFSGKLELDLDAGSFELNAPFTLGPGGSINPPTQPVSLTIGTYSVTIPAHSFVRNGAGYAFEGVIKGVSLEVLIKFGTTPGSYLFLAEGKGTNLSGTTNPVTVTLSIGNNTGTTHINAEFE